MCRGNSRSPPPPPGLLSFSRSSVIRRLDKKRRELSGESGKGGDSALGLRQKQPHSQADKR